MTKVLKELAFGLSRGFGIYFSQHNEFIETVMSPGRALKNFRERIVPEHYCSGFRPIGQ
ncbi:MAG TPA: hypothetical protein VJ019_04655 [Aestuariivirga sp.]|nr:hypothetical protein [Aestuariivirga sp.]